MADALVRPAVGDDAPTLARLQIQVWQQAYSELLPAAALLTDPEQHADRWAARVAHGGPVFLAFEGSEPVGLAAVELDLDDEGYGQVELLHVLLRWSRRGHGGRLLGAVAQSLRGLGASTGRWWAPETDPSVPQFLGGAGWAPDGARRVLDTGDGTFAEIRYAGNLDLVVV